jgi:hypothetical protein
MFGYQLVSGSCGCGCGCAVQVKNWYAGVNYAESIDDNDSAIDYINANWNTASPLNGAWTGNSGRACWVYGIYDSWGNDGDPTVGPFAASTQNGVNAGGPYEGFAWNVYQDGGSPPGTGGVSRISWILPYSTAYIIGAWYSASDSYFQRQACVMTGTPTAGGWLFNIPIPPGDASSLISGDGTRTANVQYNIYVPTLPCNCWSSENWDSGAIDIDWSDFTTYCAANPTMCSSACLTPTSPCLAGDPFWGDDPP